MKKIQIILIVISLFIIMFASINANNDNKQKASDVAKQYLKITSFSKKGLIEQLMNDGFNSSDSLYGANNCNANWYNEAKRSAKTYLEIMDYETDDLIIQLEFDGFTHDEAIYGANQNGL